MEEEQRAGPGCWMLRLRLFKPVGLTANNNGAATDLRLMLSGFVLPTRNTPQAHLLRGLADWEALSADGRPSTFCKCLIGVTFNASKTGHANTKPGKAGFIRRRENALPIWVILDVEPDQLAVLAAAVGALKVNQCLELALVVEDDVEKTGTDSITESSNIRSYSISTVDSSAPAYAGFTWVREDDLTIEVSMSSPDVYFMTHSEAPGGVSYRYHANWENIQEHPLRLLFERSLRESGVVTIRPGHTIIEPYQALAAGRLEEDVIYGSMNVIGIGREQRPGANGTLYGSNAWEIDVQLPGDLMKAWSETASLGHVYGGLMIARIRLDTSKFKPPGDPEAFISEESAPYRFLITSFYAEATFPGTGEG